MISVIILTKNEERNIAECLDGLDWCDEKIVIDDNSEDKTVQVAEKKGAKVYTHKLVNFSDQRNFAIEKAKGNWLLYVDADERVSPELCFEITHHINVSIDNYSGFYIKRVDIIWGKKLKYGESQGLKLLRLAKKDSGKWTGDVHETWAVPGKKRLLINPLYHYPHQTIAEFLGEINNYTDIRSKELFKQNVKTNWFLIILYTKAKFAQNYFIKLGFLDGMPGFISALMMSFHSYLVRGKLWTLWQKNKTNGKKFS